MRMLPVSAIVALIGALGVFTVQFTPLGRELCRLYLGKQALSKCKAEDVPAVLKALYFDKDGPTRTNRR